MSVRSGFLLLVLVNLLAFIWGAGYMSGRDPAREPERLSSQINADKIRLMPPAGPMTCQQLSALDEARLAELKQVFSAQPAVELVASEQAAAPSYWIAIPNLESGEIAARKQAELRSFGVTDSQIVEDVRNGPFAVFISGVSDEVRAQKTLDELTARGVRSARLVKREAPPTRFLVKLRWPQDGSAALQEKLGSWIGALPANATVKLESCPGK